MVAVQIIYLTSLAHGNASAAVVVVFGHRIDGYSR
jgi:hypothetical protein